MMNIEHPVEEKKISPDYFFEYALIIPVAFYVFSNFKYFLFGLNLWMCHAKDGKDIIPSHVENTAFYVESCFLLCLWLSYMIFGKGMGKRIAITAIYFILLVVVAGGCWGGIAQG